LHESERLAGHEEALQDEASARSERGAYRHREVASPEEAVRRPCPHVRIHGENMPPAPALDRGGSVSVHDALWFSGGTRREKYQRSIRRRNLGKNAFFDQRRRRQRSACQKIRPQLERTCRRGVTDAYGSAQKRQLLRSHFALGTAELGADGHELSSEVPSEHRALEDQERYVAHAQLIFELRRFRERAHQHARAARERDSEHRRDPLRAIGC
jgi:hypothetical protein